MVAIRCEDIGKRFKLRGLAHSLQEVLTSRRPDSHGKSGRADFWALKNVSFELNQGEVLGLLGRNGAGKSTLLKLISHVTAPTEGRITLRGRVGSLLEVGVGFHPELTGRENIFLSGVMLGMKHREIKRCFSEIVEFSGTEKFIDIPIKRYSSGMIVRLGFAVAAHVDQEILLIDEVLSVGDAEFQRKCLSRVAEIAHDGRTIVLVSHHMQNVLSSCSKALYLDGGHVVAFGNTDQVARQYTADIRIGNTDSVDRMRPKRQNWDGSFYGDVARFEICEVLNENFAVLEGGTLELKLSISCTEPIKSPNLVISVLDSLGNFVGTNVVSLSSLITTTGSVSLRGGLTNLNLMPGPYSLRVALYNNRPTNGNEPIDLLLLTPCFEAVSKENVGLGQMESFGSIRIDSNFAEDKT